MTKDELSIILTKLDMLEISMRLCIWLVGNAVTLIGKGRDPGAKLLAKEQKRLSDAYNESAEKYIGFYNKIYGKNESE